MASTNFARGARVRETQKGLTPANPVFRNMYGRQLGLAPNDPFGRSEVITGDRGVQEQLRLGASAAGNFSTEMAGGWTDWIFEGGLFDDFDGFPEAYNVTADSSISNIVASSQTITAAGAWVPGMLVEASGFAAGNGEFTAQASSGSGTLIAPAATFPADVSAPPAGARLLGCGVAGASGDLVGAADGITSTSLNFTLFPFVPYMQVEIVNLVAGVTFIATVLGVSANKLTLTDLPSTWAGTAVGQGAGRVVKIYAYEFAENGNDVHTESQIFWNSKTSPLAYELFKGVAVNQLTIPYALNSLVVPTAQLVGFRGGISETLPSGATFADPLIGTTKQPMKTGDNIARLLEGGAAAAATACCQQLTLTVNNNLQPVGCLTDDAPVDYNEGDSQVTAESVWRFRDKALIEKYYTGALSSTLIVASRGGWRYSQRVHAGVYTASDASVPGRNQEHTVRMRMEAQKHATTGKWFSMGRLRSYL
ncbi:MAG: hypothetical protein K2Q06_06095 [Parvularculaceae bacterium]|nr:hypothetical protein [Parvularculaceae bacterium]